MHPRAAFEMIVTKNQSLFDAFLNFPKPMIAAVNGPGIGACVTSATLCDAIVASERATFSTPFARLGVPAEGCSSYWFEQIMGKASAAPGERAPLGSLRWGWLHVHRSGSWSFFMLRYALTIDGFMPFQRPMLNAC